MIKSKLLLILWFSISLGLQTCQVDDNIINPDTVGTWKYYDTTNGLTHNNVTCMVMNKNYNIWAGTYGGGVCKYDSGSWTSMREINGLPDNRVFSLTFDGSGNLWVGTYQGISIIGTNGAILQNIPTVDGDTFKVRTLFNDTKNNIWIGTDSIFYIYEIANDVLYYANYGQGTIYSICEDSNARIWLACDYGAIFYTYNTSVFNLYSLKYNNYYFGIRAILIDNNKNMWFGLFDLDKAAKKTSSGLEFINLYNADVISIVQDKKLNIWFTTLNGGVIRYDGVEAKSYGLNDGIKNLRVPCSLVDNNGDVWFGTGGNGICIYIQE